MIRTLPLFIICCVMVWGLSAQCPAGQSQIIVSITPDNYPQEIRWSLRDQTTNALIDTGNANSDTVCVSTGACTRFRIYDSAGDGICCGYGQGSYRLFLNGIQVATGGNYGYNETQYLNCPPGINCSSALSAVEDSVYSCPNETWYAFVPDSTGEYTITTCNLGNSCDNKLYVYDYCSGLSFDEGNLSTELYNDDFCGLRAQVTGILNAGTTYYIRLGDYQSSCSTSTHNWKIIFNGPVVGCTDSTACNYDPLATVSDTSCVYFPSSLCPAPDLVVLQNVIENSLQIDNYTNTDGCLIGEGCVTGYGPRTLLRFTTHIKNIGTADYYIGPPSNNGQFLFDPCHGHWHYEGYAEYLLYDAEFNPMQVGFKNGFCVLDLECSGGGQAKFGCGNMGISAGCGDIYGSGLSCQWIDLTTVDTGNYTLVVRVNWDQSPDVTGKYETTYNNNWAQVCFNLHYDNQGQKAISLLSVCEPYVDCAGDSFGNATTDCAGDCNGIRVRGDININQQMNAEDVGLYLQGITQDSLTYSTCIDVSGNGTLNVYDAALVNGCLLENDTTHTHPGVNPPPHEHCEFPFGITNIFDTVYLRIEQVDTVGKFVDLSVRNPECRLLAYEFYMRGMTIDTVINLATGNYNPQIQYHSQGKIVHLARNEESLSKQILPLHFLRIKWASLADSVICLDSIVSIVNSDYEEVIPVIENGCYTIQFPAPVDSTEDSTQVFIRDMQIPSVAIQVLPNPNPGSFEVYVEGRSLEGAEIEILNVLGERVYRQDRISERSNRMYLETGIATAGVYTLQVHHRNYRATQRFVRK